jgi:hypothetical protein
MGINMSVTEFGINADQFNAASTVDQRDLLIDAKAVLDSRISSLRAEIAQSHRRFVSGDPAALGRDEYFQRLADQDEARAKVARLQIELSRLCRTLRRDSAASRNQASSRFERQFMRTAKRALGPDLYDQIIAETNAAFGDQQAA